MDPPYTESQVHSGENTNQEHSRSGSDESNHCQSQQQPQSQQEEKRSSYSDNQGLQHQPSQTVHYADGRYQTQFQLNALPPQQYVQQQTSQTFPYYSQQYLQPRRQPTTQSGSYSIQAPPGQPHLLPLQTPNYVPTTYNQQLSVQSPYNVAAQTPSFAQLNQGFQQPKSRLLSDPRSEDSQGNPLSYNHDRGLVSSMPSLHVQQQTGAANESSEQAMGSESSYSANSATHHSNHSQYYSRGSVASSTTPLTTGPLKENQKSVVSQCTRCKKEFVQIVTVPKENEAHTGSKPVGQSKVFKLCHHCRELQRQRSRRWQKKTKDKKGVCRRCGNGIPFNEQKFVLCPSCRSNLRTRKANRASQGRCVHCSNPLDDDIGSDELVDESNGEEYLKRSPKANTYRVCSRCRGKDKMRRYNLEQMGYCNRCTKALDPDDHGKHKLCLECRLKKKQYGGRGHSNSLPDQNLSSFQYGNNNTQIRPGEQSYNNGYASQQGSVQAYGQHYTLYPQYSSRNTNLNIQLPHPSTQQAPSGQSLGQLQFYTTAPQPVAAQQPPYFAQQSQPTNMTSFQSAIPSYQSQSQEGIVQSQTQGESQQGQNQDFFATGEHTHYSERRT
ncbi:hypothetical protein CANMA_001323 [Candida margitis]|uniref:uncharacterized protein n=1 Tax=Candida margitis TaxID=1775924 RepID=UPI0022265945|nr:uncharacterized protein CANMA_001323 [Candida margitis]KAI5969660.1 hypothetical protein CANMA_001323 [Candida margitis]